VLLQSLFVIPRRVYRHVNPQSRPVKSTKRPLVNDS